MPDAPRTISVEIDETTGLLHGRVAEGEITHEFDGWLGLLTALGSVLDGPAPGGTAPTAEH